MVVIRLSRGGSKARPSTTSSLLTSACVATVLSSSVWVSNPSARGAEEGLRIALDRVTYWKSVGAQASETAERLIKQAAAKVAA